MTESEYSKKTHSLVKISLLILPDRKTTTKIREESVIDFLNWVDHKRIHESSVTHLNAYLCANFQKITDSVLEIIPVFFRKCELDDIERTLNRSDVHMKYATRCDSIKIKVRQGFDKLLYEYTHI